MTGDTSLLRDVCHLIGGLLLDGANISLLQKLKEERVVERLADGFNDDLRQIFNAMQQALDAETAAELAAEYTRLLIADGQDGARRPLPVPPWSDCYREKEKRVLGENSRTALKVYLEAGLGFEGMKNQPADHIGLEFCFLAALLDEEESGERDASARQSFLESNLARFAAEFGGLLSEKSRLGFWREVGRATSLLPGCLQNEILSHS